MPGLEKSIKIADYVSFQKCIKIAVAQSDASELFPFLKTKQNAFSRSLIFKI